MENYNIDKIKKELAEAIKRKDTKKIQEISDVLNIPKDQKKYFEQGLTGYPSVDKVWLKYYKEGAEERANNIPLDKTVWDVIEEKLIEHYDIPALEYFGKVFSRQEFIDSCYTWARTFRAMGVEKDEIVPVYGPFVPDICAMVFALNMIGACPYFLKLAISPEALAEETKEAKVAVVFDGMWGNVAHEFSKDKFKNVIVATVTDDMPSPKKQIVSFLNKIQSKKNKSQIPDEKKYIWVDKAKDIANYYSGNVKVPFESNRASFITSSSGTTVGGIVKGTVATNESTISQLLMGKTSEVQFYPGDRCLNHFPPTASTSLNLLFMLPLYIGETVLIDPRVSEKDFYNQLLKLKPNMACHTGSAWEAFFNRIDNEMKQGKKFDFSYAKGWTVGGEGTDIRKFQHWNEIMDKNGAQNHLFSGYGSSEVFSAAAAEKYDARYDYSKSIMSVGIPYAGITMGVFNNDGREITYNARGELRIKSKSSMKGYYNKPDLTSKTKINNWICTGDLAEIDNNGFIYIWGRTKDSIDLVNGEKLYLFDVANKIKENIHIDDAIVLSMPLSNNKNSLVAHIVWKKDVLERDKKNILEEININLKQFLPFDLAIDAYSEHKVMLPYSPTTLKKDKNKLSKQTSGYIQIIDGKINNIEFILNEDGKYSKKCAIIEEDKVKSLKRR